jgi:post-segregation antitoxin (ccd killing protein)
VALKNVTITLPEELVREARHAAVDRGLSLSAYVGQLIAENSHSRRRRAWLQMKQMMHEGFDFGIGGRVPWTRDELHDRAALRRELEEQVERRQREH